MGSHRIHLQVGKIGVRVRPRPADVQDASTSSPSPIASPVSYLLPCVRELAAGCLGHDEPEKGGWRRGDGWDGWCDANVSGWKFVTPLALRRSSGRPVMYIVWVAPMLGISLHAWAANGCGKAYGRYLLGFAGLLAVLVLFYSVVLLYSVYVDSSDRMCVRAVDAAWWILEKLLLVFLVIYCSVGIALLGNSDGCRDSHPALVRMTVASIVFFGGCAVIYIAVRLAIVVRACRKRRQRKRRRQRRANDRSEREVARER